LGPETKLDFSCERLLHKLTEWEERKLKRKAKAHSDEERGTGGPERVSFPGTKRGVRGVKLIKLLLMLRPTLVGRLKKK